MPTYTADSNLPLPRLRPIGLRRSWLFCAGADAAVQAASRDSKPDVLIPDLEDFTPPDRRAAGRTLIVECLERCRQLGIVAAVRINPLETVGREDLAAVMQGRPAVVFLPKTVRADQVIALDEAITRHERMLGMRTGSTEIVPNVETAAGLVNTLTIARASARVSACLVAAEDMAADLGAERAPDGIELLYARQRFLLECRAAGVLAIDAPYTFSDAAGARAETIQARRLGYSAKSLVAPAHTSIVNAELTPGSAQVAQAQRLVAAFETARARGLDRIELDGVLVELPTYLNAKRLLERHHALAQFGQIE